MGVLIGVGNTVPQFPYKDLWYGILINLKNHGHNVADGKLQRVGNLDLHRSLPIQKRIKRFVANADGTVNYWLGANDSTLKEGGGAARLNALDGDVMLYKPNYYRKFELIGDDYLLVAISEVALPGFTLMREKARSPWYATFDRTTNKPVSASFLQWNADGTIKVDADGIPQFTSNAANFRGGNNTAAYDGKYNTLIGMPATSTGKSTIRTRCVSKGANWHHGGWRFREEMGWLMAIEFGDLDSQAAYNAEKTADGFAQGGLGMNTAVVYADWGTHNGYNPFIPCGITAKLGNNTGIVEYSIPNWNNSGTAKVWRVPSYRGWEAPQQYLWEHCDDVIIHVDKPSDGGARLLYLCSDPTKFATPADKATSVPEGYVELGRLPDNEGYISAMGVANGYSFPNSVTGGAANKDYCDYHWRPAVTDDNGAEGFYQLLAAAYAAYAEDAGVRCANANNRGAGTAAYYGFPLCLEYPLSEGA